MMKIFGIFLLNFLWLRNTTMTVKFATIPTEAVVLWMIRIFSALEFSLLEFPDVEFKLLSSTSLFSNILIECVIASIIKYSQINQMKGLNPNADS